MLVAGTLACGAAAWTVSATPSAAATEQLVAPDAD